MGEGPSAKVLSHMSGVSDPESACAVVGPARLSCDCGGRWPVPGCQELEPWSCVLWKCWILGDLIVLIKVQSS